MDVSDSSGVTERLSTADAELTRERRRTTDELEALSEFETRVRSITAETVPGGTPPVAVAHAPKTNALDRIREAYRSTVMSVSHYEEEYGDSYPESLRGEFNDHVAAALVDGTAFDRRCKRAVLAAVSESRSGRESLVASIDVERESLHGTTEALSAVDGELGELASVRFSHESFGALDAYRARLGVLEAKCETISKRRQTELFERRRTGWLPRNAPDIAQYFYRHLDVDYPAIAAVTDLVERIETLRRRIERAMAFCHA